jgi:hypothetical protein
MLWHVSLAAILAGSVEVRPQGGEDALPPLEDEERYRLVLQGTFEIDATGRRYDARRSAGKDGRFSERHGLVRIDPPGAARLVKEDAALHRYEYEVRAPAGTRLRAWVDLGRLQEDLLLTRGELALASTGAIWADLWVDEGGGWGGVAAVGGAAAALAGAIAAISWRSRQRRRPRPTEASPGPPEPDRPVASAV